MHTSTVLCTTLPLNTPLASAYVTEAHICSTHFITQSAHNRDCCTLSVADYTIGLWDGAFCDSVIIKKFLITSTGLAPANNLALGRFGDWDIGPSAVDDAGGDS